eukprot:14773-Heterococcus_DN1.PRE.2
MYIASINKKQQIVQCTFAKSGKSSANACCASANTLPSPAMRICDAGLQSIAYKASNKHRCQLLISFKNWSCTAQQRCHQRCYYFFGVYAVHATSDSCTSCCKPPLLMYLCTALKLCSFGAKDGAKALTLANRATKLHATFIIELGVDHREIKRAQ